MEAFRTTIWSGVVRACIHMMYTKLMAHERKKNLNSAPLSVKISNGVENRGISSPNIILTMSFVLLSGIVHISGNHCILIYTAVKMYHEPEVVSG